MLNNKVIKIIINSLPVILMIILIKFVDNDYLLALICVLVIIGSLIIKYERNDWIYFILGLILMTAFELFFVWAGSETFNRVSLFGILPIWLPIIWGYGFMAIKRMVMILEK